MESKFKIGEEVILKKESSLVQVLHPTLKIKTKYYLVLDVMAGQLVKINNDWYSSNLFESTRKIRIDKINTILDEF